MAVCSKCHGTGTIYDNRADAMVTCPQCNGTGEN